MFYRPLITGAAIALAGCQTSEKERRSERLVPAAETEQVTRTGDPTVEAKTGLKKKHKRCSPSDPAADTRSQRNPTVDMGVQSDITKGGLGKPTPYSQVDCNP